MNSFKVLGLKPSSTEEEVKQAYRRLALLHHPDKAGQAGEEKMKEINAAYAKIISENLCRRLPSHEDRPKKKSNTSPRQEAPPWWNTDHHPFAGAGQTGGFRFSYSTESAGFGFFSGSRNTPPRPSPPPPTQPSQPQPQPQYNTSFNTVDDSKLEDARFMWKLNWLLDRLSNFNSNDIKTVKVSHDSILSIKESYERQIADRLACIQALKGQSTARDEICRKIGEILHLAKMVLVLDVSLPYNERDAHRKSLTFEKMFQRSKLEGLGPSGQPHLSDASRRTAKEAFLAASAYMMV